MNPVKSLTSCDILWNNASVSCPRTTPVSAASWMNCPCWPHRCSVPDPASSPHRTSTALWPSPPHSQVTDHNSSWWVVWLYTDYTKLFSRSHSSISLVYPSGAWNTDVNIPEWEANIFHENVKLEFNCVVVWCIYETHVQNLICFESTFQDNVEINKWISWTETDCVIYRCAISLPGTLDVRLMGCQDLLENVPGRSKAASVPLPGWSPSETRSSFISRANRNRGVSSRNLTKSEELSSEYTGPRTL